MAGKAVATAAGFMTYQLISTALMGVANFVSGSIEEFVKFEYAMAGVARTVQDFAENKEPLTEFADTMSQKLGIAADEVAEAMGFMGSVGKDSGEIMGEFNDIAQMAVALQIDLKDAVSNVVKAQQIWNREGYTALEISDTLNEYTNRTALSMEWLAGALRMGGPAAAATNTSMEEMLAILVELAEAGATGTTAGRGLNTILVQLGLKSEELMEHLKKLKSEGFDVNIDAMKGFANASAIEKIQMLAGATENLGDKQRTQIAQMIGGTNFLKLMLPLLDNAGDLTDNLAIATEASGSSLLEYNTVMDTSQKKMEQQEERINSLQRSIGETLTPIWLDAKEGVLGFVEAITNTRGPVDDATVVLEAQEQAIGELKVTEGELQQKLADGEITYEQYRQSMQDASDETYNHIAALDATLVPLSDVEVALETYIDGQGTARQVTIDLDEALAGVKETTVDYIAELYAAETAGARLNDVLAFISGEMSEAELNTEDLTWATDSSRIAYEYLDGALQDLNDEMSISAAKMEELEDKMYDNSLASAELRLDQMKLDRAYEEGEVSEEEYKVQTEALGKAMRDLRIDGQELSIENMKVKDSFDDQKEEADELVDKIDLLKSADGELLTALEKLGEAGGDINDVLEDIRDFMVKGVTATDDFKDSIEDLSTSTGVTLDEMLKDWGTYYKELNAMGFDSYAALQDYEDTGLLPGQDDSSETHKEYQYSQSEGVYRTGWYRDREEARRKRSELAGTYPNASRSWTEDTKTVQGAAEGFEGWVNKPMMMMVGEKGAEYVSVKNQNQSPGTGMGRGVGGNITINLPNVTSIGDPAQIRAIWRRTMQELSGER